MHSLQPSLQPSLQSCRAFRWSVSEACITLLTFTMWEERQTDSSPHFSLSNDCFAEEKILPILYQQIEDKAGLIASDELIQGLCQILASSVQFLDHQAGRQGGREDIDSRAKLSCFVVRWLGLRLGVSWTFNLHTQFPIISCFDPILSSDLTIWASAPDLLQWMVSWVKIDLQRLPPTSFPVQVWSSIFLKQTNLYWLTLTI